tara:strand:- start:1074 stop:2075 length:1002 start_codon:yes stop_codon:yes gene_type:complete
MKTNDLGRRDFIKFGLISSFLILSGCSISKNKLALRGVPNSFPSEFLKSLPASWEFLPIKDIESKRFPYSDYLQEKTDLLVLNDGWISTLPFGELNEIKTTNIRERFSNQANVFLEGLGKDYQKRILPLAVSPWVILVRNEDSLALNNKNSWEVVFSDKLLNKIVFPNSPHLLISIARNLGFGNDISKIKKQTKLFDDRNALNWVVSGKANAAVLPLSSCVKSLVEDPRLSILLPQEGCPLNWTVLVSPSSSQEPFPSNWYKLLWGPAYSRRLIRKGFFPPTNFSDFTRDITQIPQRDKSISLAEESFWNKCWSLPLLSSRDKKDLAMIWNNS